MATELYSETSLDNVEDLFASDYPRLGKTAVVLSGEGALVSGTVMGQVTATGKWRAYASGNTDGSESPAGILLNDVDATSADVTDSVYVAGHFRASRLTGFVAGIEPTLRAINIHIDEGA